MLPSTHCLCSSSSVAGGASDNIVNIHSLLLLFYAYYQDLCKKENLDTRIPRGIASNDLITAHYVELSFHVSHLVGDNVQVPMNSH